MSSFAGSPPKYRHFCVRRGTIADMPASSSVPATNRAATRAAGGDRGTQSRRSVHNGRPTSARRRSPSDAERLGSLPPTRERIVVAAAEAFAERGYFGVNLTDVVEELGLTKGALYFYFDCKDALVSEIAGRNVEGFDTLASEVENAVDNRLDAVVETSRRLVDRYRNDPIARAGSRLSAERNLVNVELPEPFTGWTDRIAKLLRAAKRANEVRADVDERAAARVIVAALCGMQLVSTQVTARHDLRLQLDAFWTMVLPGLRN